MKNTFEWIDRLEQNQMLEKDEWIQLLSGYTPASAQYLFEKARCIRHAIHGHDIYIRGLIEFTNYCKNDCYYCGIRRSNQKLERYRLSPDAILDCCQHGYDLGFRTFVLQGGEDGYFKEAQITELIREIKTRFSDCALTLSFGEHSRETYLTWFHAGADRYLLRHETADLTHYRRLHPPELSLENRKQCLWDLKEIGYQTGSGFMVGSPGQTFECLAEDLLFLQDLEPQMIGIGPFIPHQDTPFADAPAGTLELTLFLIGILRLMFPYALLPATTALGTIAPNGRELGILAGANVVMPNLSPMDVRKNYALYDNKLYTGKESAEALELLNVSMQTIGYQLIVGRGDYRAPKHE